MHLPDPEIPKADVAIAGTEADGLLLEQDRLLYRPDVDFASADMAYCACPIAIGRERHLVFADRLPAPAHGAQELTFGKMRKRVAGRCDRSVQQGLAGDQISGSLFSYIDLEERVR